MLGILIERVYRSSAKLGLYIKEYTLHNIIINRGVARVIKVESINENLLATPSISLKICYYPPQLFFHRF